MISGKIVVSKDALVISLYTTLILHAVALGQEVPESSPTLKANCEMALRADLLPVACPGNLTYAPNGCVRYSQNIAQQLARYGYQFFLDNNGSDGNFPKAGAILPDGPFTTTGSGIELISSCGEEQVATAVLELINGRTPARYRENYVTPSSRAPKGSSASSSTQTAQARSAVSEGETKSGAVASWGAVNGSQVNSRPGSARVSEVSDTRRKLHDPLAVANHCIDLDPNNTLYGGFVNKCGKKISFGYCAFRPKKGTWLDSAFFDCERNMARLPPQPGGLTIAPGGRDTEHTNGAEQIHWFACTNGAEATDLHWNGSAIEGKCIRQ